MFKNPKIYEINTRVWIKKFPKPNGEGFLRLDEVPLNVWKEIADKGFDSVWLMGIWETSFCTVKKYCFKDYLVRNYDKALKDWTEEDVIGSPYAVSSYSVNPLLGDFDRLLKLKKDLNSLGLGLVLDFVPNHFSAATPLIKESPDIFLQADEDTYKRDMHTYFNPEGSSYYFAHGRDPFFPAWEDTIQVNYFSDSAIEFMTNTIINISEYCDGLRCDMAMLALDNVFYNTWSGPLSRAGLKKPKESFWHQAIRRVKSEKPDFKFIAEAYWDLEWDLQQLGFDFTYDKKLTDRLVLGTTRDVKLHLRAEKDYQLRSVRFIENHDEERAFAVLGKHKSKAAAVIISTIQGMRLFYDGQAEGKRIKLPMQLGREPEEPVNLCINDYYNKLFSITKHEIFREGNWLMLEPLPSWEDNSSFNNLLAWSWKYKQQNCVVIVNYADVSSQCRLKFDISGYEERFTLTDMLTGIEYTRSCEEVFHRGLYVDLKPYQSHIFFF